MTPSKTHPRKPMLAEWTREIISPFLLMFLFTVYERNCAFYSAYYMPRPENLQQA